MAKKEIIVKTQLTQFDWADLDENTQMLIEMAQKATDRAYAPYSNFLVGAALKLENGEIYTGTNQENMAYPSGLCAERVAFFAAKSDYPQLAVTQVVVVARRRDHSSFQLATPCGSCRQVMSEYENQQKQKIELLLVDGATVYHSASIANLLPFQFSF